MECRLHREGHLSGEAGLIVLTTVLAHRIRRRGRLTLPEFVRERLGARAAGLITVAILIAWCAILAAQLLAPGTLLSSAADIGRTEALAMGAAFVVLYTAAGGQAGVMRSDVVQLLVMGAGLLAVLLSALMTDASPLRRSISRFSTSPSRFMTAASSCFLWAEATSSVRCSSAG